MKQRKMNLKKWDFGFRYETAIVILVWWGMAIFNISKGKSATAGLCIAASVLPVLVFVFDLLKRHSDKWTGRRTDIQMNKYIDRQTDG